MLHRFSREERLIGAEKLEKLKRSRVAVFGIGGVGSYVVEALARSGIGELDLIDGDTVSLTNINRQLIALDSTVGRPKVEAAEERIAQINPDCRVRAHSFFFSAENEGGLDFSQYDYVADAIDTVSSKLHLILRAKEAGVPVISCMGTGNKFDPMAFRVADISKTSVCPLARVMRRELKKRGISHCRVVYSKEPPRTPPEGESLSDEISRRPAPGSVSFVPSAAGLILAGEVIRDLALGTAKAAVR